MSEKLLKIVDELVHRRLDDEIRTRLEEEFNFESMARRNEIRSKLIALIEEGASDEVIQEFCDTNFIAVEFIASDDYCNGKRSYVPPLMFELACDESVHLDFRYVGDVPMSLGEGWQSSMNCGYDDDLPRFGVTGPKITDWEESSFCILE